MRQNNRNKTLRIFVGGVSPYSDNRGVAALYRGTLEFLRRSFKDYKLEICVWHTYPESLIRYQKGIATAQIMPDNSTRTLNVKVVSAIETRWKFGKILTVLGIIKVLLLLFVMFLLRCLMFIRIKISPKMNVINQLASADLIVELNFGDFFTDTYYGKLGALLNILRVYILVLSKKPLYLFPQSIGPFKSMFTRALARHILNKARLVFVRDPYSLAYVTSLTEDNNKVKYAPDLSFLVPEISRHEALSILENEGFNEKSDKVLIGVVLNPLILGLLEKSNRNVFLKDLADAIDNLIKEHEAHVVFISHGTSIDRRFDCRLLSFAVQRMLKNRDRTTVLVKEYTVEEIWGIIGLCKIVISMLTHPVMACIKQNIPVVSIAYSHKTGGIMKAFDIEKYLLFYSDFEGEKLKNILNELFIKDSFIRRTLKTHMSDINVMLAKLGNEVFQDVHNILKLR